VRDLNRRQDILESQSLRSDLDQRSEHDTKIVDEFMARLVCLSRQLICGPWDLQRYEIEELSPRLCRVSGQRRPSPLPSLFSKLFEATRELLREFVYRPAQTQSRRQRRDLPPLEIERVLT
jgi:hypothetical protein